MQNKGVIKFFAILFALVCLFQLSFTYFSARVERKAKEYALSADAKQLAVKMAQGDQLREVLMFDSISKARERFFLDSISGEPVYNILVRKYTYKDVKERELNLGLDLKGGMNVIMEVSVIDIIKALSGHNPDSTFNKALVLAQEKQKSSNANYVTLFAESFKELDPNASLAAIFSTVELKDRIKYNSTNDEVISVIREETNGAIDRTFNILSTGIKEPERVRKLLQGSAKLEFWETYEFTEIYQYFTDANTRLREYEKQMESGLASGNDTVGIVSAGDSAIAKVNSDTAVASADTSLLAKLGDSSAVENDQSKLANYKRENPLYAYLNLAFYQNEQQAFVPYKSARVGSSFIKDTARVNGMLKKVKSIFPPSLRLYWTVKPDPSRKDILDLVAIKVKSRDGKAPLGGDVIVEARQDVSPTNGGVEVSMAMNSEGARIWKNLTADNIGRQIAIVLDNYVYSYPNVTQEIEGGRSSINGGGMTIEEAQDLANILKAGKLPAPAHIVQEAVVGPSLVLLLTQLC